MKERPSACMKPTEGTTAHDCWTVAFGRSNLEGQVVSTIVKAEVEKRWYSIHELGVHINISINISSLL